MQPGKHLVLDGKECLNLASHNYLGFGGNEEIEAAAIQCVKKFGVGSCGPRAFYGTAGNTVNPRWKTLSCLPESNF